MNKVDQIKIISERTNFRQEDVETFLNVYADLIVETLSNGGSISMRGIFHASTEPWGKEDYFDAVNKVFIKRPRDYVVKLKKGSRLANLGKTDVAQ